VPRLSPTRAKLGRLVGKLDDVAELNSAISLLQERLYVVQQRRQTENRAALADRCSPLVGRVCEADAALPGCYRIVRVESVSPKAGIRARTIRCTRGSRVHDGLAGAVVLDRAPVALDEAAGEMVWRHLTTRGLDRDERLVLADRLEEIGGLDLADVWRDAVWSHAFDWGSAANALSELIHESGGSLPVLRELQRFVVNRDLRGLAGHFHRHRLAVVRAQCRQRIAIAESHGLEVEGFHRVLALLDKRFASPAPPNSVYTLEASRW
jgi:hypothetical protein